MTLSPSRIIPEVELLPEIRGLMDEYPFIAYRGTEAVRRALLVLRGIEASDFVVAAALEPLCVEDEVLA
jgi:hypothetical protein